MTTLFANGSATERAALIEKIIRDSYYCFLMEPPVGEQLTEMVAAWDEVLAALPTSCLHETYLQAIREHRGGVMLSAPELLQTPAAQSWLAHDTRYWEHEIAEAYCEFGDYLMSPLVGRQSGV